MHDQSQDTHLLIVDDEPANLRLLVRQLEADGYVTHAAENGGDALDVAKTVHPDLILLDIMLPDMDGYQVCAALKADPSVAAIPVIFLSALYEAQGKARAFEVGGVDYITKPFDFTELLARVALQLKIKQQQAEIQQLYGQLQRYAGALEEQVTARTRELQRAKDHVEAILESTSDVIILTDSYGTIQRVNRAFSALFHLDSGEVTQQPLVRLFDPDYAEPLQDALDGVVSHLTVRRMEIEVYQQGDDQSPLAIDLVLSPVAETGSVISGVVCTLRDISRHKQLEAQLRAMFARERELREMQSHFMEIVSHEFRTPLTLIQSAGTILTGYFEQLSPEKRTEKFDQIEAGINQIVLLLDHVLTLDRAQTGRYELRPGPLDLIPYCETLIRELHTTNGIAPQIVFECQPAHPTIITDETLLRLILRNLLSNAIKFSDPGKEIVFEITAQDDDVTFVVRDRGMGIPEVDQATIFDMFQRGSNTGVIRGTGLGLAIVKRSVDLLGGSVSFDSAEHDGTTFCVTLPSGYHTDR